LKFDLKTIIAAIPQDSSKGKRKYPTTSFDTIVSFDEESKTSKKRNPKEKLIVKPTFIHSYAKEVFYLR
jgi:hypothetical protein